MKKIYLPIVLIVSFFLFAGCEKDTSEEKYCDLDSDCAPASCCHATSCINTPPDCSGVMCTMECKPGTLDCGQGKCSCQNNQCVAKIE